MTYTAPGRPATRPTLGQAETGDPQGAQLRRWVLLGLFGLLLLMCAVPAYDAWLVNRAGVLVNRVVTAGLADTPARTPSAAAAHARDIGGALSEAKKLTKSAALRGPFIPARQTPIWRTYGAAAALEPSDEAFELLRQASDDGYLDRVGELWLGEVATATGHWEEATEVYQRVDASNILISEGDAHLKTGDYELAVRQYRLARISVQAALQRESARSLLNGSRQEDESLTASLMTSETERVTALYRIGKGLLVAGEADEALPVLEEAFRRAQSASPGAVVEQSLGLNLALALARTLPAPPASFATSYPSHFPPETQISYLQSIARIRGLVYGNIQSDRTAAVCVQAARTLLLIGDEEQATALLREAINLDPLVADAYLILGAWYESKGMRLLPLQLYTKAVERLPSEVRIQVAHALATYRVLDAPDALPVLEEAAETDTADPHLFAALGDCHLALGSMSKARQAYEEGLRRASESELLLRRLENLDETVGIPR